MATSWNSSYHQISEEIAIHTYNYFMSVSQKGYSTKLATDGVKLGRV